MAVLGGSRQVDSQINGLAGVDVPGQRDSRGSRHRVAADEDKRVGRSPCAGADVFQPPDLGEGCAARQDASILDADVLDETCRITPDRGGRLLSREAGRGAESWDSGRGGRRQARGRGGGVRSGAGCYRLRGSGVEGVKRGRDIRISVLGLEQSTGQLHRQQGDDEQGKAAIFALHGSSRKSPYRTNPPQEMFQKKEPAQALAPSGHGVFPQR